MEKKGEKISFLRWCIAFGILIFESVHHIVSIKKKKKMRKRRKREIA